MVIQIQHHPLVDRRVQDKVQIWAFIIVNVSIEWKPIQKLITAMSEIKDSKGITLKKQKKKQKYGLQW